VGFAVSGDRWVVSVGISECSKAKGALDTWPTLQIATLTTVGLDYEFELRKVGCAGWCFAEPFVEVFRQTGPAVIFQNVVTENVPDLVESFKTGEFPANTQWGCERTRCVQGIFRHSKRASVHARAAARACSSARQSSTLSRSRTTSPTGGYRSVRQGTFRDDS
jgi:(2Fe-2S) ferredoxin